MRRIHAGRNVAHMEHLLFSEWSHEKPIGGAMCEFVTVR